LISIDGTPQMGEGIINQGVCLVRC